jgi:hypothetical protein
MDLEINAGDFDNSNSQTCIQYNDIPWQILLWELSINLEACWIVLTLCMFDYY